MSNEERNEYMKNVRWATAVYVALSLGSILLTLAGIYYGLKGDIKDGRAETKELFLATNHKIDSLQHDNNTNFQQIWDEIKTIKNLKEVTHQSERSQSHKPMLVTEKYVNGHLAFIPVR